MYRRLTAFRIKPMAPHKFIVCPTQVYNARSLYGDRIAYYDKYELQIFMDVCDEVEQIYHSHAFQFASHDELHVDMVPIWNLMNKFELLNYFQFRKSHLIYDREIYPILHFENLKTNHDFNQIIAQSNDIVFRE